VPIKSSSKRAAKKAKAEPVSAIQGLKAAVKTAAKSKSRKPRR
jgi:hypothetical protein